VFYLQTRGGEKGELRLLNMPLLSLPRVALAALFACLVPAAASAGGGDDRAAAFPSPPCFSKLNGAFESFCFRVVARGAPPAAAVVVREMAPGLVRARFQLTQQPPQPYADALPVGVAGVLPYFIARRNGAQVLINRTTPVLVGLLGRPDPFWEIAMFLPASVYPTPASAPDPETAATGVSLLSNATLRDLTAALAFSTPKVPTEADFKAACAELKGGLPKGFEVPPGAFPIWAIYSAENSAAYEAECIIDVRAAATGSRDY
jgi:hypothetical protein